jgi:hypothetical protein
MIGETSNLHIRAPIVPRKRVYCIVEEIVDWKFWNKTSSPTPAESEQPTDTYEASKHLLGMLMRADTPPFSNWKAHDVVFAPNVENAAQSATKAICSPSGSGSLPKSMAWSPREWLATHFASWRTTLSRPQGKFSTI